MAALLSGLCLASRPAGPPAGLDGPTLYPVRIARRAANALLVVTMGFAGCRLITPHDFAPGMPDASSVPRVSPSLEIPPPRD